MKESARDGGRSAREPIKVDGGMVNFTPAPVAGSPRHGRKGWQAVTSIIPTTIRILEYASTHFESGGLFRILTSCKPGGAGLRLVEASPDGARFQRQIDGVRVGWLERYRQINASRNGFNFSL